MSIRVSSRVTRANSVSLQRIRSTLSFLSALSFLSKTRLATAFETSCNKRQQRCNKVSSPSFLSPRHSRQLCGGAFDQSGHKRCASAVTPLSSSHAELSRRLACTVHTSDHCVADRPSKARMRERRVEIACTTCRASKIHAVFHKKFYNCMLCFLEKYMLIL